jgi:hypothetical protein
MAAPKGNKFWELRSKHGRDRLFATPALMWKAACEYFQWCEDNPFYESEQKKGNISLKIATKLSKKAVESLTDNIVRLPKMRPFTMQGLCRYLNCNVQYFDDFEKSLINKEDQLSKDFSVIVTRIRETIYEQKFSGAASGFLNPNIIARDLGLSDKQELTGKGGKDLVPTLKVVMNPDGKQDFADDEAKIDD